MTKLLQLSFFVVIPEHNLGNSPVSVYRIIGPTPVCNLRQSPADTVGPSEKALSKFSQSGERILFSHITNVFIC